MKNPAAITAGFFASITYLLYSKCGFLMNPESGDIPGAFYSCHFPFSFFEKYGKNQVEKWWNQNERKTGIPRGIPITEKKAGCLAFHRIISNHVHLDAGNTTKAILLPEPVCCLYCNRIRGKNKGNNMFRQEFRWWNLSSNHLDNSIYFVV